MRGSLKSSRTPAVHRTCPGRGGSVDELLVVTVERPVLEQLQVEVGCTMEDRVEPVNAPPIPLARAGAVSAGACRDFGRHRRVP
jgi:hypothetical protein